MTIYFYKVNAPYGCFSNFSPHPIQLDGTNWQTVEHYYQAHKYVTTPNQEIVNQIQQAPTPEAAATLGRDRTLQLRLDWDIVKRDIMWRGVWTKFVTHRDIRTILLATNEEIIVEDSPRDCYWGCGQDGTGRNELGKILMEVRTKLRHQD